MRQRTPELVRLESFINPLTRKRTLTCDYGDVTALVPERDPRIPDQAMPGPIVDPARPGYGYTGRLLNPAPVILLAHATREQIERWQTDKHEPWPYGGTRTSIEGEVFTIEARNGRWQWQLHPAYWPENRDPFAWYVGRWPD